MRSYQCGFGRFRPLLTAFAPRLVSTLLLLACSLGFTGFSRRAVAANFTAQNDYNQAEVLVRNHEWDAGLSLLKPLLKAKPGNLKVLNLTGLAFTGKGQIVEANRYFERALTIDARFLPALRNLGINEYDSGQFDQAERHLSRALKQSPNDPVINLFIGQMAYKKGRFAQVASTLPNAQPFLSRDANLGAMLAISYLSLGEPQKAQALLSSVPASALNSEERFLLGIKLADAGLYEAAVPYLTVARNDERNSHNAAFDLAVCYLNLKQYADAEKVLAETIAAGGETSDLDNLMAEAYEGEHQTQKSVDAFHRAIALAPDNVDNYLDFASICIDHHDYAAALKVLEAGLETHPDSDRLFFERGIVYAMQDNTEMARKDFEKAATLSPQKDSNYKGLAILYLQNGNAAQAVSTLEQRLKAKPNDPDLLYLLGEALLRSGAQPGDALYSKAQTALEKSVKIDPSACLPHVSLGKLYLEQGRNKEAVLQLEQARADDPKEMSTYWQLATAYRKLGEPEKQKAAINALKQLIDQERSSPRDRSGQTKN